MPGLAQPDDSRGLRGPATSAAGSRGGGVSVFIHVLIRLPRGVVTAQPRRVSEPEVAPHIGSVERTIAARLARGGPRPPHKNADASHDGRHRDPYRPLDVHRNLPI